VEEWLRRLEQIRVFDARTTPTTRSDRHTSVALELMEGRIERSLLPRERPVAALFGLAKDLVAVHRARKSYAAINTSASAAISASPCASQPFGHRQFSQTGSPQGEQSRRVSERHTAHSASSSIAG
jgi:hypothetical protein